MGSKAKYNAEPPGLQTVLTTPVWNVVRVVRGFALLALVCALASCKPAPTDTGGNGGPEGGVVISGGELFGWDQAAPSAEAVRSYTFTIYVDGTRNDVLAFVRCDDQAGPTGYGCSGVLPTLSQGAHTLQLMTTANGRDSELSAPLNVVVVPR